jgi:hypothetical protein
MCNLFTNYYLIVIYRFIYTIILIHDYLVYSSVIKTTKYTYRYLKLLEQNFIRILFYYLILITSYKNHFMSFLSHNFNKNKNKNLRGTY